MPRKLKTYLTSTGFYDLAIAGRAVLIHALGRAGQDLIGAAFNPSSKRDHFFLNPKGGDMSQSKSPAQGKRSDPSRIPRLP